MAAAFRPCRSRRARAAAALASLKAPADAAADAIDQAFARAGTSLAKTLAKAAADGKVSPLRTGHGGDRRGGRGVLRRRAAGGLAGALGALLGSAFGGARADGGPVTPGGAYLVGERGPEVFRPGRGGRARRRPRPARPFRRPRGDPGTRADHLEPQPAGGDRCARARPLAGAGRPGPGPRRGAGPPLRRRPCSPSWRRACPRAWPSARPAGWSGAPPSPRSRPATSGARRPGPTGGGATSWGQAIRSLAEGRRAPRLLRGAARPAGGLPPAGLRRLRLRPRQAPRWPRWTSRSAWATGRRPPSSSPKTYGQGADAYVRAIRKPVAASVAAGGGRGRARRRDLRGGRDHRDRQPDRRTRRRRRPVTAGFQFDVPVRFDTDRLDVTLEGFAAGRVVAAPLIEVRVSDARRPPTRSPPPSRPARRRSAPAGSSPAPTACGWASPTTTRR